jgi:nitroimidazol reductase NimA-like FMN-containing flavoprotein (pyridoxamine 5'-phosphate oxidase superfamily)
MSDVSQQLRQKVQHFLKQHPMGVLSTVNDDGKPWGAAVYYVTDEDFNLYFVTRAETLKYQNLQDNPSVALTIADEPNQTTVQVAGAVSELPVEDYMDVVFTKLAAIRPKDDAHWAPPMSKLKAGNYMPFKLVPTRLQYADYKDRKSDVHADYIERII